MDFDGGQAAVWAAGGMKKSYIYHWFDGPWAIRGGMCPYIFMLPRQGAM